MVDCMVNPAPVFMGLEESVAPAAGGGGAAFGLRWSDDFERADSATLGGDWTEDGTETQYRIQSNKLDRDTTLGAPGGSCWVASGAAVASGKQKLKMECKGLKAAAVQDIVQFGFMDSAGKISGPRNGYIIRRYLGTVVRVARVENGAYTDLSGGINVGLLDNGGNTKDVALEVEKSGSKVIYRVFSDGVQIGADAEDSTPGNAANIFSGSAYPGCRSPVHDWNGHYIDSVEISY